MEDERYEGLWRPDQFEGMAEHLQGLFEYNANGDNAVSLREFITALENILGEDLCTEQIVSQYGEGYDWI